MESQDFLSDERTEQASLWRAAEVLGKDLGAASREASAQSSAVSVCMRSGRRKPCRRALYARHRPRRVLLDLLAESLSGRGGHK